MPGCCFNIPRIFNNYDNSNKGAILPWKFIQGFHSRCCFIGRRTPHHLKVTGNSWQPPVLLTLQGSLPQVFEAQGLKHFQPGACSFCRLVLLQALHASQLFTDCGGIRCALQWAPHLLKRTKKRQDFSDSFTLGRTPRMDSMTFGIYYSSDSQRVLRNKDNQGKRLYSMHRVPTNFNKGHRFYLESSILQNDLALQ